MWTVNTHNTTFRRVYQFLCKSNQIDVESFLECIIITLYQHIIYGVFYHHLMRIFMWSGCDNRLKLIEKKSLFFQRHSYNTRLNKQQPICIPISLWLETLIIDRIKTNMYTYKTFFCDASSKLVWNHMELIFEAIKKMMFCKILYGM